MLLGSGAGLGTSVARRLRSEGYRVATVSRSSEDAGNEEQDSLALTCDLADPKRVEGIFATVREKWGQPSVVVYNGSVPQSGATVPLNSFANIQRQHMPSLVASLQNQRSKSQRKILSAISPSTPRLLSSPHARL